MSAPVRMFASPDSSVDESIERSREKLSTAQRLQAAMALVQSVQRDPTIHYMCDGQIPVDLMGSMELPIIPERKLVVELLEHKCIDQDDINRKCHQIITDFLSALKAQDWERLEKLAEPTFLEKIRDPAYKQIPENPASGSVKQEFAYEPTDYEAVKEKIRVIDKLIVKGVRFDRRLNDSANDYVRMTSLEQKGMRQFYHEFFGMQDYYYLQVHGDTVNGVQSLARASSSRER